MTRLSLLITFQWTICVGKSCWSRNMEKAGHSWRPVSSAWQNHVNTFSESSFQSRQLCNLIGKNDQLHNFFKKKFLEDFLHVDARSEFFLALDTYWDNANIIMPLSTDFIWRKFGDNLIKHRLLSTHLEGCKRISFPGSPTWC